MGLSERALNKHSNDVQIMVIGQNPTEIWTLEVAKSTASGNLN